MLSSGKKVILLSVVAVAAGAAILFAKRPPLADAPQPVGGEPRAALARRLPARAPAAGHAQHLVPTIDESGFKVPTASTPGTADLRVGLEFAPQAATGYGRLFNPAGAMLEPRVAQVENSVELASDPDWQIEPQPATVAQPAAVAQPVIGSRPRTHTVIDGDTLTALAARYLGSSDRYRELFAANRKLLASPDLLPIGAVLEIPPMQIAIGSPSAPLEADVPAKAPPLVPVPKGALNREDD